MTPHYDALWSNLRSTAKQWRHAIKELEGHDDLQAQRLVTDALLFIKQTMEHHLNAFDERKKNMANKEANA